ncbi:MAG: transporter substrate-binding domain-containing protein [Roseibium sp.]|uniref:transporter substrate-binding domain-containing protein n=1 Tax=Roseibium sp. TaxID=1936156 RepID=UPI0026331B76|nr:transporter substrate-binding domain-containing protein [Roseibium sp.]MCV0427536.1 transporter substrate-binding domain-containing protein [Roseibium sp.]
MSEDTISIGVLFSQTGPMAVTENAHIRGVLLACEEINAAGGIDGRRLDPLILDPAGSDDKYADLATELLVKHRVNVIFGTCLSTSRKAVVPVVERFNGVLFYPSVYEGFEYSPNVIYGGAVPNQVVIPLLEYIFHNLGHRIALIGSDTLYAREINRVVNEFMSESGGRVVAERYFPFSTNLETFAAQFEQLQDNEVDAIISTVVGEDSIVLYNAHHKAGKSGDKLPIASLTTTESELTRVEAKARAGHISVAPYFSTLDTTTNETFRAGFAERFGDEIIPGVYSEVCYSQVQLFANAVRQCGSDDTELLLPALSGAVFKSPGGDLFLDIETNHLMFRPLIGRSTESGEFDIVFRGKNIFPDPYLVAYDRTVAGNIG